MKAYHLHDTETEEILGTVVVTKLNKHNTDVVHTAWSEWNKEGYAESIGKDKQNIEDFVADYNKGLNSQIEVLDLEFVQP
jgi:hypothetical protein